MRQRYSLLITRLISAAIVILALFFTFGRMPTI